ncbi:hypothetical protein LCGC14_0571060 [marine sediment metagenome]|uniref:Uncharacterized protein n=1 Tax=marine sediment metagenome TaxID=412755 RepID=A0A0F9USB3_9ZZZZ
MKCDHKKIKKNYPFGKKSKPEIFCSTCNQVVKLQELMKVKNERENRMRRRR